MVISPIVESGKTKGVYTHYIVRNCHMVQAKCCVFCIIGPKHLAGNQRDVVMCRILCIKHKILVKFIRFDGKSTNPQCLALLTQCGSTPVAMAVDFSL